MVCEMPVGDVESNDGSPIEVSSTTTTFMDADETSSYDAIDDHDGENRRIAAASWRRVAESLPPHFESSGIECYGDDREALYDFAKYFNNEHLSDVSRSILQANKQSNVCRSAQCCSYLAFVYAPIDF